MAKEVNNITPGAIFNAITYGTKITGKVEVEGDFRVDGEVEGDIICNGKVILGQKALLNGTVTCTNAEISGTVNGKLTTSEMLSLQSTSVVNGDIKTKTLTIQPNAVFNGNCSMKQNEHWTTTSEKNNEK